MCLMRFTEWVSRHGIHKNREGRGSSMTLPNWSGMHCDSLRWRTSTTTQSLVNMENNNGVERLKAGVGKLKPHGASF